VLVQIGTKLDIRKADGLVNELAVNSDELILALPVARTLMIQVALPSTAPEADTIEREGSQTGPIFWSTDTIT
jgi:hypothetical protein